MYVYIYIKNYTSIGPKQFQNDSFRPILVKKCFTPRAACFINEFLSALTSPFVRPHSSPASRATEASHRAQGRGHGKDKRRTRPGHTAQPQRRRTRRGQEEDKAWTHSPATEEEDKNKRRTRHSHKAQPQRTRGGQGLDAEPSHRGQEEDKAWTRIWWRGRSPARRIQKLLS